MNLELMSYSTLEQIAERAEDYLIDNDIPLVSHSYRNIILQALSCGFNPYPVEK
jgi:hypothetical protein